MDDLPLLPIIVESSPRLPVSSADVDCALSVGTGELIATSGRVVEGTLEGTVTIMGLAVLSVGDSKLKSLGATKTSFFRAPAVIRRSPSACN